MNDLRQIDYPPAEEIVDFAAKHNLDNEDVLRDIARLIAIHEMATVKEFLNEDCVLCGGMAMRLYGSPRFSVPDTDISYRLDHWDEIDLQEALDIEVEDLTMSADQTEYWERRTELTISQPVEFKESFVQFETDDRLTKFKVTVARRGLFGPARFKPLVHDYSAMGIERTEIPVMDLTEQAAEKLIGCCANGLAKHYLDAAWIFGRGPEEVDCGNLREWTDKKLAAAFKREPANYKNLRTRRDMVSRGSIRTDTGPHRTPATKGATRSCET